MRYSCIDHFIQIENLYTLVEHIKKKFFVLFSLRCIPLLIENEWILYLKLSFNSSIEFLLLQEQEIHQHRVQHEVLARIQRHRDNLYISNYRRVQRQPI